MILHEGLTAKKYSYVITISEEKYLVKTCLMKDVPISLPQESVAEKKAEKKIDEIKRVPIPEPKGDVNKKIVPPLSDGSKKIIGDQNSTHVPVKKKVVKK